MFLGDVIYEQFLLCLCTSEEVWSLSADLAPEHASRHSADVGQHQPRPVAELSVHHDTWHWEHLFAMIKL